MTIVFFINLYIFLFINTYMDSKLDLHAHNVCQKKKV